jgi:hypothetical protein
MFSIWFLYLVVVTGQSRIIILFLHLCFDRVENTNLLLQLLITGETPPRAIIQVMLSMLVVSGSGSMIHLSLQLGQIKCCMTRRMSLFTNSCKWQLGPEMCCMTALILWEVDHVAPTSLLLQNHLITIVGVICALDL